MCIRDRPYIYSSSLKFKPPNPNEIKKPELLDKMIELSEKLSAPFLYVRVDWYYVNGKIYFGELTFMPGAGYSPFIPQEWDEYLSLIHI